MCLATILSWSLENCSNIGQKQKLVYPDFFLCVCVTTIYPLCPFHLYSNRKLPLCLTHCMYHYSTPKGALLACGHRLPVFL